MNLLKDRKYFQWDLHRVKEFASGVQNILWLKSYTNGHRNGPLGSLVKSAWSWLNRLSSQVDGFHPVKVPLKVFSVLFKVHLACCDYVQKMNHQYSTHWSLDKFQKNSISKFLGSTFFWIWEVNPVIRGHIARQPGISSWGDCEQCQRGRSQYSAPGDVQKLRWHKKRHYFLTVPTKIWCL